MLVNVGKCWWGYHYDQSSLKRYLCWWCSKPPKWDMYHPLEFVKVVCQSARTGHGHFWCQFMSIELIFMVNWHQFANVKMETAEVNSLPRFAKIYPACLVQHHDNGHYVCLVSSLACDSPKHSATVLYSSVTLPESPAQEASETHSQCTICTNMVCTRSVKHRPSLWPRTHRTACTKVSVCWDTSQFFTCEVDADLVQGRKNHD